MAICQNMTEATEAIREVKAHCRAAIREVEACSATTIREWEAHCTTTIREAEACSSTAITEAEAHCAGDIREAESCCADYAHTIQQSHSDSMQCLEREAIEEEQRDCLSFLATCGIALQASPLKPEGY